MMLQKDSSLLPCYYHPVLLILCKVTVKHYQGSCLLHTTAKPCVFFPWSSIQATFSAFVLLNSIWQGSVLTYWLLMVNYHIFSLNKYHFSYARAIFNNYSHSQHWLCNNSQRHAWHLPFLVNRMTDFIAACMLDQLLGRLQLYSHFCIISSISISSSIKLVARWKIPRGIGLAIFLFVVVCLNLVHWSRHLVIYWRLLGNRMYWSCQRFADKGLVVVRKGISTPNAPYLR